MKELTIVGYEQFGYLTDTLMYCRYLDGYRIHYYCIDQGLEHIELANVEVHYFRPYKNPKITKVAFLLNIFLQHLFASHPVFIVYFPQCHILRYLLGNQRVHLDIRTLCISDDEEMKRLDLLKAQKAFRLFRSVSAISEGLAQKLHLKNYQILPLGADALSTQEKDYSQLRLLYVGTLSNRNIEQTIEGFSMYLDETGDKTASYDIIGYGVNDEDEVIRSCISRHKLQDRVRFHGRKKYAELVPYFEKCNIGVSYIPIVDHFQNQPPTKTFEYIMSGLYCIATQTNENAKIVNEENGVLIQDSAASFNEALKLTCQQSHSFDADRIRSAVNDFSWKKIVEQKLKPIIDKL